MLRKSKLEFNQHTLHVTTFNHQRCNFLFAQECNIEEASDEEEPPSKSSKDKKANGPDSKASLVFKITSKVPYKTVLKGIIFSKYILEITVVGF